MAEPEVVTPPAVVAPPLPEKSAVEVFNEALTAQPEQVAAPPVVAGDATAPPPPPAFDPATIVIPKDAPLPSHFAKYAGKSLAEIMALDLETDRYARTSANEANRLKQENADLRAAQAARKEIAELLATPAAPVDDWARVGITPETPVWDQPRAALEATRTLAREDTEKIVEDRVNKAVAKIEADKEADRRNAAIIGTFEAAKAAIRAGGHAITDEEWSRDILPYIAPRIAQEETVTPGVLFDPSQYVERFHRLRGAPPKPVVPSESAPPVGSRVASITPTFNAPTASNEATAMKTKVAGALVAQGKWTEAEAQAYIGG